MTSGAVLAAARRTITCRLFGLHFASQVEPPYALCTVVLGSGLNMAAVGSFTPLYSVGLYSNFTSVIEYTVPYANVESRALKSREGQRKPTATMLSPVLPALCTVEGP